MCWGKRKELETSSSEIGGLQNQLVACGKRRDQLLWIISCPSSTICKSLPFTITVVHLQTIIYWTINALHTRLYLFLAIIPCHVRFLHAFPLAVVLIPWCSVTELVIVVQLASFDERCNCLQLVNLNIVAVKQHLWQLISCNIKGASWHYSAAWDKFFWRTKIPKSLLEIMFVSWPSTWT